jgi:hypothetical protein
MPLTNNIDMVNRIAAKLMEQEFSHTEYSDSEYAIPGVGSPVYKQKYPTYRDAFIAAQLDIVVESFDDEAIVGQCGGVWFDADWDDGY